MLQIFYIKGTQQKRDISSLNFLLIRIKNLSLDSVLAKREVSQLLLLTNSLLGLLERSQSSTHGTGLLDTEIQGSETLLLVEETKLFTLSLVDDSQDTGNVLASFTTIVVYLINDPNSFSFPHSRLTFLEIYHQRPFGHGCWQVVAFVRQGS